MESVPTFRFSSILCLCLAALLGPAACAKIAQSPAEDSGTGGHSRGTGDPNPTTGGIGGRPGAGSAVGPSTPPAPGWREHVDPSVPAAAVMTFANAGSPATGGVQLVYPSPKAIIPRDLAPVDVQWNAVPGATVYKVSLAATTGDRLTGYVTSAHFLPSADDWRWLLVRAAGGAIEIQVSAATSTGQVSASAPQQLLVSRDDATGALFYFGTTGSQGTGSGTLYRLAIGATAPTGFINGTITNGLCVGCHTITRDGKRMSFAYSSIVNQFLGSAMTLGNVDVTNPAVNLAPANTASAVGTFNPDGTFLLTSNKGKLTLRNGSSGAPIADVVTSGLAMFPDWSPDGGKIVFVRPGTPCTPGGLLGNWGQDSVIVLGGSLVTMDFDPVSRTFSNEQVIFAGGTRSAYYPSYSPDGAWIAFTRTDGASKPSWSGAASACLGSDGTGASYDNPSATTWLLPAKGGEAFELATANGGPMQTNSWPKWGPRKDGDYLWLSFTSTRAYGNVLPASAKQHQLWIAAIPREPRELSSGDLSTPAVWFPFQDTVTKNHVGMWTVNVPTFVIE